MQQYDWRTGSSDIIEDFGVAARYLLHDEIIGNNLLGSGPHKDLRICNLLPGRRRLRL